MIVLHGKERETCVEERKGAQKSGSERGRSNGQHRSSGLPPAWKSVDVCGGRWKDRTRWTGDIVVFHIYFCLYR